MSQDKRMSPGKASVEKVTQLVETIRRLRAPDGCPWDRAQTHQTLRPYLIEESYEVLDVLDLIHQTDDLKKEKIKTSFQEELGDVLMQVLLHSEMTSEVGAFNFYDVAGFLNEKLIRRHPHVFARELEATQTSSAEQAFERWEKEKAKEKANQPDASVLDGVPKSLPALQKASRVIEKVTKVGFQWSDLTGPLEKLEEEIRELKAEIEKQDPKTIEAELGDVLFSLCNVASFLKVNPEDALRGTLARFEKRFRFVERSLKKIGKLPEQSNLEEMDSYWAQAKNLEKVQVWGLTGGMGSGKSAAAQIFSELGIPVIDADELAREIRAHSEPARLAIQQRFGTTDSEELRKQVFQDSQSKKDLENILHPLIQIESQKKIEALAIQHPIIIYEASLLIETGRYRDMQGLIVVEANPTVRMERLKKRDHSDPATLEKMIASQTTDDKRRSCATTVIHNNGSLSELNSQVRTFCLDRRWID